MIPGVTSSAPKVLSSDRFSGRAVGSDLSGSATDVGHGGRAGTWEGSVATKIGADGKVHLTSFASGSVLSVARLRWNRTLTVSAVVRGMGAATGTAAVVAGRNNAANSYYHAEVGPTGALVLRYYNGTTTTTLASSAAGAVTVGSRIAIRLGATTVEGLVNGEALLTATHTVGKRFLDPGLRLSGDPNEWALSDWVVETSEPRSMATSDSFNRAGPDLGSSDAVYGGTALAWSVTGAGAIGISGNEIRKLLGMSNSATVPTGSDDMTVSATITQLPTGSDESMLSARFSSTSNMYFGAVNASEAVVLGKLAGGVRSTLASSAAGIAPIGSRLAFSVAGSRLALAVDGVEILTADDTSLAGNHNAGVRFYGPAGTVGGFDDFTVEAA